MALLLHPDTEPVFKKNVQGAFVKWIIMHIGLFYINLLKQKCCYGLKMCNEDTYNKI